jgi:hypothetical protein
MDRTSQQACRSRSGILGWSLAGGLFLAIAAIYAFATSFSYFAKYDDEGYLMVGVRAFLGGGILYQDMSSFYGPFYYFYEWLFHSVTALPVTHDVTRALCIFHWLTASLLLTWACGRLTRSMLVAVFVFMQTVLHLTLLAREPGHPQELVAVLLALAVLVSTRGLERKGTLPGLAAIGAALACTKINVGAFYMMALGLLLACHLDVVRAHRNPFLLLVAFVSFLPLCLMRSHISEPRVSAYAAQVCISILAASAVSYSWVGNSKVAFVRLVQAGGVFLSLTAIFVTILLIMGTPLASLFENLVVRPAEIGDACCIPLIAPYCSWSGIVALFSAAALVTLRERVEFARLGIALAKGMYGVLGSLFLVTDFGGQLGYLLPWTWLVLVGVPEDRRLRTDHAFARGFLCLAAVWQGLQAYPVAGTQTAIGTLLPVLIYSICLHDAFTSFVRAPWSVRNLGILSQRTTALMQVLLATGLLYIFSIKWCNPVSSWRYYVSLPKLGLPGAGHLRLPEDQARRYRELATCLQAESDTFITIPGLNSLYLWTGKTPPTSFTMTGELPLKEHEQAETAQALRKFRRPMIVVNTSTSLYFVGRGPLHDLIGQECREARKFGEFTVLQLVQ